MKLNQCRLSFLFIFLSLGVTTFAQDETDTSGVRPVAKPVVSKRLTWKADTIQGKNRIIGTDEERYRKLLNQQFTNILTGQARTSVGNYGSLDLKTSEVAFAGSTVFKGGSVATVRANGGVTDGILGLFENSKVKGTFGAEVQYHILALSHRKIRLDLSSTKKYEIERAKVEYQYKLKRYDISKRRDLSLLQAREKKLNDSITTLKNVADSDASKEKKVEADYIAGKLEIERDSLRAAISDPPGQKRLIFEADDWRIAQKKKLDSIPVVRGFQFGWLSLGYKINNREFSLFNPKAPFELQVVDTNNISHDFRIQYSFYRWAAARFESYFWDIGALFSVTDNFQSLDKQEMSETTNYGPLSGARAATKKYTAYSGDYYQKLNTLRIYADYYRFLFRDNVAALHIYPGTVFQEGERPVYNVGVGFFLSFKDEKSSVFNAELFYDHNDMFDAVENDASILKRRNLGLRFTFPIKFKSK